MQNRFIDLLKSTEREGMTNLIGWLEHESDFFTAPASAKYHGAKEGGLLEHSLAVYDWLVRINGALMPSIPSTATTAIVALLHDLCKANFYTVSQRNVKNEETGKWEKQPYYSIEDQIPFGHGEKSVMIMQRFIKPTLEEMMAIRWHMGAWGATDYVDKQSLSKAMDKYPLILALQMADQITTFFDGK